MERSLEELAEEITTLAAHVNAAMCRWLGLVAEFDAREGWAEWGCKSCAHWIAWRCSIVPTTARDHVRVARRLQELPLIRAAFAKGELSYSKVRALTRVTEVEQEDELLELARRSTASQLERLVRAYRGVAAVEAGHAAAHESRFLDLHHDDDGALVIRGRLPAEEGALVLAAIEAARERLERERRGEVAQRPARHASAEAPAAEPASAEAPAGDPSVVAATPPPPPSNADALLAIAEAGVTGAAAGRSVPQVVVHVDVATLTGAEGSTVGVLDDGTPLPAETVRRLCCDGALVAMSERDGRTLSVGRRTRTVPAALRRAIVRRDGGCRFPGCQQRARVDAHHIRHWAHGGETSADNLVLLCRHHHRLVHEHGYRVERRTCGELVFRRPDGRRLRPVPAPRRGDPGCLTEHHRRTGLRIDSETSVPLWHGERLDLDLGVQALLAIAPLDEQPGI